MIYDSLLGDYKSFKSARKEYAKLAVQDLDAIKQLPRPNVNVPLFSRYGMRMMKIWFCELFRIKTPEEKLLNKMGKELKAKQKINSSMS